MQMSNHFTQICKFCSTNSCEIYMYIVWMQCYTLILHNAPDLYGVLFNNINNIDLIHYETQMFTNSPMLNAYCKNEHFKQQAIFFNYKDFTLFNFPVPRVLKFQPKKYIFFICTAMD